LKKENKNEEKKEEENKDDGFDDFFEAVASDAIKPQNENKPQNNDSPTEKNTAPELKQENIEIKNENSNEKIENKDIEIVKNNEEKKIENKENEEKKEEIQIENNIIQNLSENIIENKPKIEESKKEEKYQEIVIEQKNANSIENNTESLPNNNIQNNLFESSKNSLDIKISEDFKPAENSNKSNENLSESIKIPEITKTDLNTEIHIEQNNNENNPVLPKSEEPQKVNAEPDPIKSSENLVSEKSTKPQQENIQTEPKDILPSEIKNIDPNPVKPIKNLDESQNSDKHELNFNQPIVSPEEKDHNAIENSVAVNKNEIPKEELIKTVENNKAEEDFGDFEDAKNEISKEKSQEVSPNNISNNLPEISQSLPDIKISENIGPAENSNKNNENVSELTPDISKTDLNTEIKPEQKQNDTENKPISPKVTSESDLIKPAEKSTKPQQENIQKEAIKSEISDPKNAESEQKTDPNPVKPIKNLGESQNLDKHELDFNQPIASSEEKHNNNIEYLVPENKNEIAKEVQTIENNNEDEDFGDFEEAKNDTSKEKSEEVSPPTIHENSSLANPLEKAVPNHPIQKPSEKQAETQPQDSNDDDFDNFQSSETAPAEKPAAEPPAVEPNPVVMQDWTLQNKPSKPTPHVFFENLI